VRKNGYVFLNIYVEWKKEDEVRKYMRKIVFEKSGGGDSKNSGRGVFGGVLCHFVINWKHFFF